MIEFDWKKRDEIMSLLGEMEGTGAEPLCKMAQSGFRAKALSIAIGLGTDDQVIEDLHKVEHDFLAILHLIKRHYPVA